jgi:hypothetical protein
MYFLCSSSSWTPIYRLGVMSSPSGGCRLRQKIRPVSEPAQRNRKEQKNAHRSGACTHLFDYLSDLPEDVLTRAPVEYLVPSGFRSACRL